VVLWAGPWKAPDRICNAPVNISGIGNMRNLIVGFVLGSIVATVGFGGIAKILDHGVETIKSTSQELAK
jgi:hypothetical protein